MTPSPTPPRRSPHPARPSRRAVPVALAAAAVLCASAAPAAAAEAGALTPFIYGGDTVQWAEHSETAYLTVQVPGGVIACGSTFLTDEWVLTAAHCVTDEDRARATTAGGLTSVPGTAVAASAVRVQPHYVDDAAGLLRADRVVVDPGFRSVYSGTDLRYVHDDAALVHLSTPASGVDHAALARDAGLVDESAALTAYGWGDTDPSAATALSDTLRVTAPGALHLTGGDFPTCDPYATAATPAQPTVRCVAAADGTATGTGQGDSGGPWFAAGTDGVVRQVGITSYGPAVGVPTAQSPEMIAYVPALAGWIDSAMASGGAADGQDGGDGGSAPGAAGSLGSLGSLAAG